MLGEQIKHSATSRLPMLTAGDTWRRLPLLLLISVAYAAIAAALYLQAGLGEWSPAFMPVGRSLGLVAGLFVLPCLVEELFWRWTLIPPGVLGKVDRRSLKSIALSTALFTAAHPLAALLFVPHARGVFYRPEFLAIVALLGLTCGAAYVLSKSIWPPVVIHWVTVLAWKFLLGGPFVLLGR